VLGFTYNFINTATQYQNGVDLHFDWGASQFLTKQVQAGLVGYAYKDVRHRAAVWLRLPAQQRPSGLHQSQGLRRIWRLGSALRLEHMADICHLTRGSASTRHEPDDYEITVESTVGNVR
jgi:outer membrane putative beta-barrel porin/alpha-amylase